MVVESLETPLRADSAASLERLSRQQHTSACKISQHFEEAKIPESTAAQPPAEQVPEAALAAKAQAAAAEHQFLLSAQSR